MTKGIGYELICLVTLCSSLAAFMSTSDSTVIGIANVASVDIIQGSLKPNANPKHILYGSKFISFAVLGAGAWLSFDEGLNNVDGYRTIIDWLIAFLWVTLPTWIYGLFSDFVKSRALIIGIIFNV